VNYKIMKYLFIYQYVNGLTAQELLN